MKVAVLQSNYLPWKGYFDIINDVDVFYFYDDVQFTKNDWRNRNKIKTQNGSAWITVPCKQGLDQKICDVMIADSGWQRKHWEALRHNYHNCVGFAEYAKSLQEIYLEKSWNYLSELNQCLIRRVACDFLGIKTKFLDSRNFVLKGESQNRLLDLLKQVGATYYVSGPAGRNYIDDFLFAQAGIKVEYKDYAGYPEYPQKFPPFDHYVSIVDLLFCCGRDAPDYIWGWRSKG